MKSGDRITLVYEGKEFDVIIIDPDGLGKDQPSVGFGFNMMERYAGIPQSTLSTWVYRESEEKSLKLRPRSFCISSAIAWPTSWPK